VTNAPAPKGWIPTLVVGLLMVGIVGSGFLAENAVADVPPVPVGLRGTEVTPSVGWDFAGRSDDQSTFLLTNGTGSLSVEVQMAGGPVLLCATCQRDPLDRTRDEWLATGTVTASQPEAFSIGGHTGRRFTYSGTFEDVPTPVEGTVTYIAGISHYALFDGWAGEGQYSLVSDDIDGMVGSSVIQ